MSQTITVIPGDGIGPEIMECTLRVLRELAPDLEYDHQQAGLGALHQGRSLLPQETIDSIGQHRIALKGPLTTPVGEGFTSLNVHLRKLFDLYANVRPAISFPGTRSRYENIDLITVRENTEGAYGNDGAMTAEDGSYAEGSIRITRLGSERIARHAFELARNTGRKKVTAVHKANIMKTTSGLFLRTAREISQEYPDILFNDMIVDNTCMQLVMNPHQFDVIVTTNLFGDIISDLCAGLVGGLGLAPGANIGRNASIFEAVHGSAPDIAGRRIANPSALMLAAGQMLTHLGRNDEARRLTDAIRAVLTDGTHSTPDLGGTANCDEYTDALLRELSGASPKA